MSLTAQLPTDLTTPQAAAALLAATRRMADELSTTAQTQAECDARLRRLEADFVAASQRLEEAATLRRQVERQPTGEEARLLDCVDPSTGRARAVGRVTRRTWGGSTWEVREPGLLDMDPVSEWHADVQRVAAARSLYRLRHGRGSQRLDEELVGLLARAPRSGGLADAIERAWSDTSGTGGEWVPDTIIPTIYQDYFVPNLVSALFPVYDIRGPVVVAKFQDTHRPYIKGRVTSDTPSAYTASTGTSSQQVIDPAGIAVRTVVDDALPEDTALAVLPLLMASMGRAVADGYEDAMLNGDTATTHQDTISSWNIRSRWGSSGLGLSGDHRRVFVGLRALAYDRSATVDLSATQTAAGVMAHVIGGMGERAASDLVILTSPEVMYRVLATDPNLLTVDKMGSAATLLTGQVASIAGHPVIMTRWMSADLAATGLYTGTGAKSGLLAVDRSAFAHWRSRSALVEIDKDITTGVFQLVGTLRQTFQTLSAVTEKVSFYAYNLL